MSGGSKKQTVGYKYHLGAHMALCHGPVDAMYNIEVDRRVAWTGLVEASETITVSAPNLFGGDGREGGVSGDVDILMGEPTQPVNAYLQSQLGSDLPAFRAVFSIVLNQCYVGNNPYLKPWAVKAARILTTSGGEEQWNSTAASIDRGDDDGGICFDCDSLFNAYGVQPTIYDITVTDIDDVLPIDSGLWNLDIEEGKNRWDVVSGSFIDPCDSSKVQVLQNKSYLDNEILNSGFYGIGASNNILPRAVGVIWKFPTVGTVDAPYLLEGDTRWWVAVDRSPPSSDFAYDQGWDCTVNMAVDTNTGALSFTLRITDTRRGGDVSLPIGTIQTNIQDENYPGEEKYFAITAYVTQTPDVGDAEIYCDYYCIIQVAWEDQGVNYCESLTFTDRGYTTAGTINNFVSATIDPYPASTVAYETRYMRDGNMLIGFIITDDQPIDACALFDAYLNNINDDLGACTQCNDMNPAHIIRECLTDSVWGMGYNSADIDNAAFGVAATTLLNEGMGISILWEQEQAIEEFIGEILRHIDAVLYVSRTTGKFVLKLVRAEESDSNIITLDESNISEVKNAKRPTISELTNSVSVVYWDFSTDEDASLTVHNNALRQIQGVEISTTIQYPGFTNQTVAGKVADRDLKALSVPLLTCEIVANREAAGLNVGDIFILDWPDLEINNLTMRINEIDYGDGLNNSIQISCIEDVFSLPGTSTQGNNPDQWVDPALQTPDAPVVQANQEAPYWALVQEFGETTVNNELNEIPDGGYPLFAAGRKGNELNATIKYNVDGTGLFDASTLDFSPYAYIEGDIGYTDENLVIANGKDLDLVDTLEPVLAQIGDELIKIESIEQDSVGGFTVLNVGRGVLDTVPAQHQTDDSNGIPIAIIGDFYKIVSDSMVAGETVDVRLLTNLNSDQLAVEDAIPDVYTFNSRAIRPYPPGNFRIDGQSYPNSYVWSGSHTLTWAHRDRLQQTDQNLYDYSVGDIGPEAGTEYVVEAIAIVGDSTFDSNKDDSSKVSERVEEKFLEVNVGSDTSYSIDLDSGIFDSNYMDPPAGTEAVLVRVRSLRDGYDSWQYPQIKLQYPGFTDSLGIDSIGDSNFESIGDSNNFDSIGESNFDSIGVLPDSVGPPPIGDEFWGSVIFLNNMDEIADASSAIEDQSYNNTAVTLNNGAIGDDSVSKFTGVSVRIQPTDDNMNLSSSALNFGSQDLTIEGWVYVHDIGRTNAWFGSRSGSFGYFFLILSDGSVTWNARIGGSYVGNRIASAAGVISQDQWYHIALTRDGNDWKIWVDGTQVGSTHTASGDLHYYGDIRFGVSSNANETDSDLSFGPHRITKGVCRYSSTFTPPGNIFPVGFELYSDFDSIGFDSVGVDPFWDQVTLLVDMNGDVTDRSQAATSTLTSGAVLNTVNPKFASHSLQVFGSNDYLRCLTSSMNYATVDFTLECWVFYNNLDISRAVCGSRDGSLGWFWFVDSTGNLRFSARLSSGGYVSDRITSGANAIVPGRWYHVALSRTYSTNTWRMFIDGQLQGTNTAGGGTLSTQAYTYFGVTSNALETDMVGFIGPIRLTSGVNRYTASFPRPRGPFPQHES